MIHADLAGTHDAAMHLPDRGLKCMLGVYLGYPSVGEVGCWCLARIASWRESSTVWLLQLEW